MLKCKNAPEHPDNGFTLVELLVAIAVSSIVLVIVSTFFVRSGRIYVEQNVLAALQQEVRAAMEIMGREIRMAGYDPLRTGDFKILDADATKLRFTLDLDEDGVSDPTPSFPECETISFRFSAANSSLQIICGEGTPSQDPQTLIGGTETRVTNVNFDYRDNQDNSTSFIQDIRGVVISLTAESPAGSRGMVSRTFSTRYDFRNAAPNAVL